jgi:hypothetical protein
MSDAPGVSVSIDDAAVRAMLERAPEKLRAGVSRLVEGAAIDVQREMRIAAPVAVTGQLRKSIRYTFTPSFLRAEVSPNVPYAERVEKGGPPERVSVKPGTPLRAWAEHKGLNPYAVRNSIARKGTKEHPFVEPTYDKMKPVVERDIAQGIAALVEGLSR